MQGDFSRDTFDPRRRFSRVLMQQGRVLVDADWNEQARIHLHYLRTLAADLIGPHGGPRDGFRIRCGNGNHHECDFTIGWGHYYVDGILVENLPPPTRGPAAYPPPLRYAEQPHLPLTENDRLQHDKDYLVYLDVWERHVTHLEADHIREVALGGPDTATRAQVVWQVKVADASECGHLDQDATCEELLRELVGRHASWLRARARVKDPSDDPCIIPPEARYRGAENQLYRVEIHDPGPAGEAGSGGPTFKWSRDNGSVAFAISGMSGSLVELETLGPDACRGLREGDWVEVIGDRQVLHGRPGLLARVDAIDRVKFEAALGLAEGTGLPSFDEAQHPVLRRWDQGSDAIAVQQGRWIDLEDGVQVWFEPNGTYRTGDYWMIPARTAIGDILWPTEAKSDGAVEPTLVPPHGVLHHYAPLARVRFEDDEEPSCEDCRCTFEPHCPGPDLFGDVYFDPDAEASREGMRDVLVANADLLRTRLAVNPEARVQVVGCAPRGRDEARALALATNRAQHVKAFYVARGIAAERIEASARLDHSTQPPAARHRVVTRLVTSKESTGAGEAGIAGLRGIPNVGLARARILLNAGLATPLAVASTPVEAIKHLLNVNDTVAEKIRESARKVAERHR